MNVSWKRLSALAVLVLLIAITPATIAHAAQSSSTNYSVNEVFFGNGGELNACSSSYCAKQSLGETGVGNTASNNFQAQAGFNTTDEPLLEVSVTGGEQDLGVIDTDNTGTATAVIKVRNYLSNGYIMQLTGTAPSLPGGHVISPLTTPTSSHQGAEQFGINLADNTAPNIGANPVQVPDGSFSYGQATSDYSTPDLFKYVDGDIIAQSPRSSGETDYMLSIIMNVSNVTPAGKYHGTFSAVVTATF